MDEWVATSGEKHGTRMKRSMGNTADSEEPSGIACFIALGASNLTRGFRVVTGLARATWGDPACRRLS